MVDDAAFLEGFLKRAGEVLFPAKPRMAKIMSRGSDGDTPLHLAALWGDRLAIQLLIGAGAEVNACGDMSNSPLYYSVMNGHVLAAETLLNAGADPHQRSELGYSPNELAQQSKNRQLRRLFATQRLKVMGK